MADTLSFDHPEGTIYFDDWADDEFGEFHYRTRDGRHEFVFDLQPADALDHDRSWYVAGEVVVFIVSQPSYGRRASDPHATHRITCKTTGRPAICIGRAFGPPTSVSDALSWAVYWSQQTARYVDTGKSFS